MRGGLPAVGVREPLRLDRGVHVLGRAATRLPSPVAQAVRPSTPASSSSPSGEICAHITGDEAFAGYWNRPDADAKAVRDGWYHTGDTGHLDADGDLWVDGRLDDMIISGGENIHPLEVEDVLAGHPGVCEVAVSGPPTTASANASSRSSSETRRPRSSTRTASPRSSPASSARASTASWRRSRRAHPGRSCAGSCATETKESV